MEIGDKVRLHPKLTRGWDPKIYKKYDGFIATIRSLGIIPTVWIKANTNAGKWWCGFDYEELELVSDDTELGVMN